MKLFEIDPDTKLPVPTAAARTIKEFRDIIKRLRPIDGDADGRKKHFNLMELAFIYFAVHYDSRFKLLDEIEREKQVKELIGLPEDWKPDQVVQDAIKAYADTQVTESSAIVDTMIKTIVGIQKNLNRLQEATVNNNSGISIKDMKDLLDITKSLPDTLKSLKESKEILRMEQDSNETGRNGRQINKFEV